MLPAAVLATAGYEKANVVLMTQTTGAAESHVLIVANIDEKMGALNDTRDSTLAVDS